MNRQNGLSIMQEIHMKIGFIGAGVVGQTLAAKLAANGHDVMIGIRNATQEELAKPRNYTQSLADWLKANPKARAGTFAEAAAHGDIIFNVTGGEVSIAALTLAGAANLKGKVLVDVGNPLDFSQGFPPVLTASLSGRTSLGEEIQKAFPEAKVVKAFNTLGAAHMVDTTLIGEPNDLFLSGNEAAAKAAIRDLAAKEFGWTHFTDLGDISGARAQEALVLVWLRIFTARGNAAFNFHVAV
jgi:8-hydroxy-5-deazaflavin:NADPH oxidoreductase